MSRRRRPKSRAKPSPDLRRLVGNSHNHNIDQRPTGRVRSNIYRAPHLPQCDKGNKNHRASGSAQLGEQKILIETTNITHIKHVGDENREVSREVSLQQSESNAQAKKRVGKASRRKTRHKQAFKVGTLPPPARIRAYKAAGLDTVGLWSFSQRNRAKALAAIEPEPDVCQIRLFEP